MSGPTQTDVEASLKILTIMNIDEIASSFSLMFELKLKWNDLHLTFSFLKEDTRQNIISKDLWTHFWTPNIRYLNDKDEVRDKELEIAVERQGIPTMQPDKNSLHANETYPGSQNAISLKSLNRGEFDCSFESIMFYPFDEQNCSMIFYIYGSDNALTNLYAGKLKIFSPYSVGEYQIIGWYLDTRISDEGGEMASLDC